MITYEGFKTLYEKWRRGEPLPEDAKDEIIRFFADKDFCTELEISEIRDNCDYFIRKLKQRSNAAIMARGLINGRKTT